MQIIKIGVRTLLNSWRKIMYRQGSFQFEENDSVEDIRQGLPEETMEKVTKKFADLLYKSMLKVIKQKEKKNESQDIQTSSR